MDTEVEVAFAAPYRRPREAAARVEALFREYERTLTRFSPDSELSALNRSSGRPFVASPLLFGTVQAAVDAARDTGGIFDPTILTALEAAGYDRTFAAVPFTAPADHTAPAVPSAAAWQRIELVPARRTILLPAGLRLDLGGIGKGLAVDAAAALLDGEAAGYFVNAGGDLFARGEGEDCPWIVGVQNPFEPEADLALLVVRDGAVATSSAMRRRWLRGARERHHLIDPATGESACTDLAAVTVMAPRAAAADVLAKVALILGGTAGPAVAERHGARWLMVARDGSVRWSHALPLVAPAGAGDVPPAA